MEKGGTRTASLSSISQDLLTAGAVVFTGGHDVANSTLLTFPAQAHAQLETWSSDRLLSVLRHYVHWLACTQHVHSVSCLADLQHTSKVTINVIVEAVEKLELQARGTVNTLYFLKPQVKSRSRLLKKLLGLKPSKKHPKIPLFKVVLLKTYQEVFSQIDLCQLTSDFGGTLAYDHHAWMQFHKTVTPCVREAESVLRRLPELRDRVELLREYETAGQTAADIHSLLAELTDKYHHIISEVQFQEILDRCKQTLLTLDSTEASERWIQRVNPRHVRHVADYVRRLYQELDAGRWDLEEAWKGVEENIMGHMQIQRHRERAVEIERKIKSHFEPLMKEHPCVGNTLSQAELYRTHFTTSLYEPAKELLSQATEILQHVHRPKGRAQPQCDVTDIVQRLTVALQPFTQDLQSLQDVYVAVHIFHLLFQKAMSWYRKVLKFLPDSLQQRVSESASAGTKIMAMPVEWHQTVQGFLAKHPPPREQHISRLDTEIPSQVEKRLRLQARSLALRLRLLQRVLFSRRLAVKLLAAIFGWKAEVYSTNQANASPSKERAGSKPVQRDDAGDGSNTQNLPSTSPKPSRLVAMGRSVSYSSSDTGELEYTHLPILSASGFQLHDSPSEEESNTQGSNSERLSQAGSNDGVLEYKKPPKLDVKILSPNAAGDHDSRHRDVSKTESNSDRSDDQEQMKLVDAQTTEAERFIRLTFSPTHLPDHQGRAFNFDDSLENDDFTVQFGGNQAGSESGIEVAEEPWENVIDKIKAVSNSNLPSEVKIQCMTHLLSRSTLPERHTARQHGDRAAQRDAGRRRQQDVLKFSDDARRAAGRSQTFRHLQNDYQPRYKRNTPYDSDGQRSLPGHADRWRDFESEHFASDSFQERRMLSQTPEKPAHTVARLRHRLAQSMWDLDSVDHQNTSESRNALNGWASTTNLIAPPKPARQFQHTLPDTGRATQMRTQAPVLAARTRGLQKGQFDSPMHRSYENGLDSAHYENSWNLDSNGVLSRSYENGLDSLHLPGRAKQSGAKMVAWKSYGDGLDSDNSGLHLNDEPSYREFGRSYEPNAQKATGPMSAAVGPSTVVRGPTAAEVGPMASGHWEGGADDPVSQPSRQKHEIDFRHADQKNPYRWRQSITGEYLPASPKSHQKSRDFISPSFLRPYSSMTTINFAGRQDEDDLEFAGQNHPDVNVEGQGEACLDAGSMSESDTTSFGAGSRQGRRDSTLDRMSDEMDQEYLSQDEVESSLKRSHRILIEAEEKLKQRATRTSSAPDNFQVSDFNTRRTDRDIDLQPQDLARSRHDGRPTTRRLSDAEEDAGYQYEPIQITIDDADDDNDDEWGDRRDVYSESPEQYSVDSSGLMVADCEWDADVSTLSDANSDSRVCENTKL